MLLRRKPKKEKEEENENENESPKKIRYFFLPLPPSPFFIVFSKEAKKARAKCLKLIFHKSFKSLFHSHSKKKWRNGTRIGTETFDTSTNVRARSVHTPSLPPFLFLSIFKTYICSARKAKTFFVVNSELPQHYPRMKKDMEHRKHKNATKEFKEKKLLASPASSQTSTKQELKHLLRPTPQLLP